MPARSRDGEHLGAINLASNRRLPPALRTTIRAPSGRQQGASTVGRWSRAEIEEAFAHYREVGPAGRRNRRLAGVGEPVHPRRHLPRAPLRLHGRARGHLRLDPVDHERVARQRDDRRSPSSGTSSMRIGAGWCARCGIAWPTPATARSTRNTTSPCSSTRATGCGATRRTSTTRTGSSRCSRTTSATRRLVAAEDAESASE